MTGAFTDYPTTPSIYDETVAHGGEVRPGYEQIATQFDTFGLEDVRNRGEYVSKSYHDQGVTFDYEGEERPFADLVARRGRGGAARHRAGGLPRRRLRPDADHHRPGHPPAHRHDEQPLPPGRLRHPTRQRRPGPCLGDRPHPRRRGRLPRARGQRPHPQRGVLRPHQPPGDDLDPARGGRDPPDPAGRGIPQPSAAGPARRRTVGHHRPRGRRAHPRALQLGLLRALAAGAPDGCRARRGA